MLTALGSLSESRRNGSISSISHLPEDGLVGSTARRLRVESWPSLDGIEGGFDVPASSFDVLLSLGMNGNREQDLGG